MERSVELARMIQRSVCEGANRPDKGVHQAGFLVLRETSMPSCLIELGFITTPDEENLLNNDGRVDDIAKGIYEAFAKYKNKYDKRVSVPYRASEKEVTSVPKIVPDTYRQTERRSVSSDTTARTGKPQVQKTKARNVVRNTEANKVGTNKVEAKPATKPVTKPTEVKGAPVFKLQIFVSSRTLRKGDAHFKGETDYDSYQEGGMVKYTMGASTNYNEIYRLRKSLLEKFPEAFIIAFKNGRKYDVNQAIREFKQNKKR